MVSRTLIARCASALAWACTFVSLVLSIETVFAGKANDQFIVQYNGSQVQGAVTTHYKTLWANDTDFEAHNVSAIWAPPSLTTYTYQRTCTGPHPSNLTCAPLPPSPPPSFPTSYIPFRRTIFAAQQAHIDALDNSSRTLHSSPPAGIIGVMGMTYTGQLPRSLLDNHTFCDPALREKEGLPRVSADVAESCRLNRKADDVVQEVGVAVDRGLLSAVGDDGVGKGNASVAVGAGEAGVALDALGVLGTAAAGWWVRRGEVWGAVVVVDLAAAIALTVSASKMDMFVRSFNKTEDMFGGEIPGGVYTLTVNEGFVGETWAAVALSWVAVVVMGAVGVMLWKAPLEGGRREDDRFELTKQRARSHDGWE